MTEHSISDISELRAAFLSGPDLQPCPTDDALWCASEGSLLPEELTPLLEHITQCGACAQIWALATQAQGLKGETAPANRAPTPEELAGPIRGRWVAGLLTLAAAALLALTLLPGEPAPYRDGATAPVELLLPTNATIARGHAELRWRPHEGARYEVSVTTTNLDSVVQQRGLREAKLQLSPEDLSELKEGTVLLWRVVAVLPDGQRLASPTQRLLLE